MMKRLSDNVHLFRMLLLHQVYLDALKLDMEQMYVNVSRSLYAAFIALLSRYHYKAMDQFTKTELLAFVTRFDVIQRHAYAAFSSDLLDEMMNFAKEDRTVVSAIFSSIVDKEFVTPVDSIWRNVIEEPIPANGLMLPAYIASFAAYSTNAASALIRQGYANAWTMQEMMEALSGTPDAGMRDGLFARLTKQQQTLVNTVLQYVSATTQNDVAADAFEYYQWISVLDSRTTDICRERAGMIYKYGEGPLPPAHYNCRGVAVPLLVGSNAIEFPYFELPEFVKPLTVSEFADKLPAILAA